MQTLNNKKYCTLICLARHFALWKIHNFSNTSSLYPIPVLKKTLKWIRNLQVSFKFQLYKMSLAEQFLPLKMIHLPLPSSLYLSLGNTATVVLWYYGTICRKAVWIWWCLLSCVKAAFEITSYKFQNHNFIYICIVNALQGYKVKRCVFRV